MLRRLKNRLIDLGLRQRDLARMVQLSEPEVSDIIRGIRTPGPDLKRRISKALGMPAQVLFSSESKKAKSSIAKHAE